MRQFRPLTESQRPGKAPVAAICGIAATPGPVGRMVPAEAATAGRNAESRGRFCYPNWEVEPDNRARDPFDPATFHGNINGLRRLDAIQFPAAQTGDLP